MNEYEGLNLPQLLDLMLDLAEPAPAAWAPQTVGWLVAALWLVAVMLVVSRYTYVSWRRNRYRRAALAELETIEARAHRGKPAAALLAALLKRTALVAYPRREVAALYGAEWARFLRESAGHSRSVEKSADDLAAVAYRRDPDVAVLIQPARRWIEAHRA